MLARPGAYTPQTRETADHSLPYCLALALAEGDLGPEQFAREQWKDPKIIDLIEKEVEMRTTDLSQYEKIKAVLLLPRELTVEGGELTPTLKVKRRVVVEKNKGQIDRLYASKEK